MQPGKTKFLKILIAAKIVTKDQVIDADNLAKQTGGKIADALVKRGCATEAECMNALAKAHRMDYVNLERITIPEDVIELMPESVARENVVLPMEEKDGRLKVVMSEPTDMEMMEKLRFILNRDVTPVLAARTAISQAINDLYGQQEGESADSILQEFTDTAIDFTETVDDDDGGGGDDGNDENSAPIVRLVRLMITEAVQLRASDIHVEPFEDRVRIRYRIDGVLHERDRLPRRQLGAILSRIKILSNIDIAERRRPQDGRIKISVGEKDLDLRVSIIPTNHGQSAVMRLLDKDNIRIGVRQLGFAEETYKIFQGLIRRPNGILSLIHI